MRRSFLSLFGLLGVAQAFTYTVTVGIDETNGHQGIGFDPSNIVPQAGDIITFTFAMPEYIKSPATVLHSATQSTFENPCTPMPGGFDTGIQSTGSVNSGTGASFNLVVNDTQPLWFFSAAGDDCKNGMVFSVNAPLSGQTAHAFKEAAMASSGYTPASSSDSPSASQTSSGSSSASSTGSASPSASSSGSSAQSTNGVSRAAKVELGLAALVAMVGLAVTY